MFDHIQIGDKVTRLLGGCLPMVLTVTEVTDDRIICGDWEFSKHTGGEIDELLGWDGLNTGSLLKLD